MNDTESYPTSSEEWNSGVDFALEQLCSFLGVDPHAVSWDAATETVDGDVRSIIGNILRAKFGEDWGPNDGWRDDVDNAPRTGFSFFLLDWADDCKGLNPPLALSNWHHERIQYTRWQQWGSYLKAVKWYPTPHAVAATEALPDAQRAPK